MRMLALALALVACGDDDEERPAATETTTVAAESNEASEGSEPSGEASGEASGEIEVARIAPLETAGFAVVPRRALERRPVAYGFFDGAQHLALAADEVGNVLVFEVPSGQVRAVRRLLPPEMEVAFEVSESSGRVLVKARDPETSDVVDVGVWDLRTDAWWPIPLHDADRVFATLSEDGARVGLVEEMEDGSARFAVADVDARSVRRRSVEDPMTDGIAFSTNGSSLYVAASELVELEPSTLRQRSARPLPGLYDGGRHGDDLLLLGGDERAAVRPLAPGVLVSIPKPARAWSLLSDGRVAGCKDDTIHVFSGNGFADETTFPVALDCHFTTRFTFRRGKLEQWTGTAYAVVGEEDASPYAFEAGEPRGIPPRGSYALASEDDRVVIVSLERRRERPLVRRAAAPSERVVAVHRSEALVELVTASGTRMHFGERLGLPLPVGTLASTSVGHRVVVEDGEATLVLPPYDERRELDVGLMCDDDESCVVRGLGFANDRLLVAAAGEVSLVDEDGEVVASVEGDDGWLAPNGRFAVVAGTEHVEVVDANLRTVRALSTRPRRPVAPVFADEVVAVAIGRQVSIFDFSSRAQRDVTLPESALELWRDGDHFVARTHVANVRIPVAGGAPENLPVALATRGDERLYCDAGTLRLDGAQGFELGVCRGARHAGIDDDFVWWTEGIRAHLVRRSDGEHLVLGTLRAVRPLAYAHTMRGHLQLSDASGARLLRLRLPGSVVDADLVEVDTEKLSADLVKRFLAGEPLGDAPRWNEE